MEREDYAGLFLRLALAFLFFYFGIDKFTGMEVHAATFESLWLVGLSPVSAQTSVIISGVIELLIGMSLLLGFMVRYSSLAAAAWTFLIFLNLGFSVAIYDLALTGVAIALWFTGAGAYSLDAKAKV